MDQPTQARKADLVFMNKQTREYKDEKLNNYSYYNKIIIMIII